MASEPIDIAAETLNPISKLITEFTQVLDTITNAEEKELYVQLLNKYPINDTASEFYEQTPLKLCSRIGDATEGLVRALLTWSHADIESVGDALHTKSKKRTALHIAAENGSVRVIKALLEFDAQINAKDSNGQTPLHLAAKNFQKHAIVMLLEYGADRTAEDMYKQTPAALISRPFWDDQLVNFKKT